MMKTLVSRLLAVAAMILVCHSVSARQQLPLEQHTDAQKRVSAMFVRSDTPPFSFMLDGTPSSRFIKSWKRSFVKVRSTEPNAERYDVTYTSRDGAMSVVCEVTAYTDFEAVEWLLRFVNNASVNSAQITDVSAIDCSLWAQNADFKMYTLQGCHAQSSDFRLQCVDVRPDTVYRYVPYKGRPSSKTAFPFYNIASSRDCGVMLSIGWTGTWFAEFSQSATGRLDVDAGMLHTDLYLLPGESIRTPKVSLLFWYGSDRLVGNNLFRRFVLAHHSPRDASGRMITPPLCSGFDYGDPAPCNEYSCFTEALARAVVERHERFDVVPEIFWLDAGWYSGAGDSGRTGRNWYNTVGNWTADSVRFPGGLKGVADIVHRSGAKFMVWFEPERVYAGSMFERLHPEWMLRYPSQSGMLFNLGNAEACDWLCRYIGDFLEKSSIDSYRQDFNIGPEDFWTLADTEGRRGISEIRYVEGLYRFWDYLRSRFPDMLIDNCASGGRRFDLEMLDRSIPLWRTDCHYGEPNCQQCHMYGLSQFLPLHGTGVFNGDVYCTRSGMSSAYAWFGEVMSRSADVEGLRASMVCYREIRDLFTKDYYPLTGDADLTGLDTWIAYQFDDASKGEGVVFAFRRPESKVSDITVRPGGIDTQSRYEFRDEDTGVVTVYTAVQLSHGITLHLDSPSTSKLLRYHKIK